MNNRIQEIAEDCWKDTFHYGPNGPEVYTEFDYEKFSEFIVRECAKIADDCQRKQLNFPGDKIKEYFGM